MARLTQGSRASGLWLRARGKFEPFLEMRTSPPCSLTSAASLVWDAPLQHFAWPSPPCLWACALRSAFSQARRDFPGPVLARASRARRLRPRLGREEGRRPAEPAPGAAGRARGEKEGSRRSVHRFCFPRSRASLPLLGSRIGLSACQRTDALGGRSMGGRGCRAGRPSGAIVSPRVECARVAVCLTPPIQSRSGATRTCDCQRASEDRSLGSATVLAYRASLVAARPPSGVDRSRVVGAGR